MIKLIAFDWNGTLLADTNVVVEATNLARKHYGYPPISLTQYQKTFTIPIVDFWIANGGKKEDMATEHNIFHPAYESLLSNIQLRKGAKEILSWLHRNSVKSLVYSNHTSKEISRQLERFKINIYIREILARKGVEDQAHLHKRGKEAKLLDFLKTHNIKHNEVLSVGDTCEEVEIGQHLNILTVAITGGENTTVRLKQSRPSFLIKNLSELKNIVGNINNGQHRQDKK